VVKPRRVLLVGSTPDLYGSNQALAVLAAGLPAVGWEVVAALPGPGPFDSDLEAIDVRVLHVDPGVARRVLRPWQWVRYLAFELPMSVVRYWRLSRGFDVIHVNGSVIVGAMAGARLARRPVVVHLRESYAGHDRMGRTAGRVLRVLCDRVIAVSAEIGAEAAAIGLGAKTTVIHDGLAFRPRRNVEREPRVVAVGRINDWKGHDVLISAIDKLKRRGLSIPAVIAGDPYPGGQRHRLALERQARDLDVSDLVHLPGFVEDVDGLVAGSTMFVQPSTRPEPFGFALVEAMAQGTPCIATDRGGPVEIIVHDETGILIPPGDADALADAIEALWRDPARRTEMGERAASSVRSRFPASVAVEQLARVYDELA
jgi:glycosyltransferase involved in cell wall biosynthesis